MCSFYLIVIYGIISVIKEKGFIDSMFRYKIDILKALADNGYNTSRLRKDKIMSQATMQNIRQGKGITTDTINTICLILRCQPSDVIEIIPTEEEKIKYF